MMELGLRGMSVCLLAWSLCPVWADPKPEPHWAFVPPRTWPIPGVATPNPIDRFILAKQRERGLKPAPPADRRTLIRRAYFDLIGLPPEPEQVDAFLGDARPLNEAFARVVDGLLSSPHYGERWGRHWLDLARYGDSNGGDENHAYPNAYHYRNWVIDALNRDLPYDEFLRQQLAGDLLDDPTPESITATGFFALGTKILAEQDLVKQRADIVDEQIDTMSRALMALTVACARCHDHKFDPVSQREYYALAGIFYSTDIVDDKGLPSPKERAAKAALRKKLGPITRAIARAQSKVAALINLSEEREWEAEKFDRGTVIVDTENYGKGIGIISDPLRQLNYAEYDLSIKSDGPYLIQLRYAAAESRPGRILVDGEVVIDPAVSAITGGWAPENQAWSLEGSTVLTAGRHVLRIESEPMMSHIDRVKLSPVTDAGAAKAALENLAGLKQTLKETEAALSKEPKVKVMAVEDGTVTNAWLNRRGDPHDLGDEIPRGTLDQLGPAKGGTLPKEAISGRRQLADWLTSPGHPLTSRVMVNRVWRWHFGGKALVGSPDDFGTRGQEPTHPELLDYLAARFEAEGWSLKKLHQVILTSQTWQMSTCHPDEAAMTVMDPENVLYWRAEPHRLEAEAFRDAVMAVSGTLNPNAPAGPPPPVKSQDPSPDDLEKNRRAYEDYPHRSIYLPIVRCHIYDLFTLLDFPNAAAPVGERDETTVPTQALLMMNNPWLTKQATRLAERAGGDVQKLYTILYARPASAEEMESTQRFLRGYTALKNRSMAWTALCQTLIISHGFLYVR